LWRSRFDFAAADDFAAEAAVGVEVLPVVVERPWDRVRRDDGDDDRDGRGDRSATKIAMGR